MVFSAAPSSPAICLLSRPAMTRPHDVELPRGQSVERARARPPVPRGCVRALAERTSARTDGAEQGVVIGRLGEEIDRAGLHRTRAHRYVAVAGKEDDLRARSASACWSSSPSRPGMCTSSTRQDGPSWAAPFEVGLGGGEALARKRAARNKRERLRRTDAVVVDNADQRVLAASSRAGAVNRAATTGRMFQPSFPADLRRRQAAPGSDAWLAPAASDFGPMEIGAAGPTVASTSNHLSNETTAFIFPSPPPCRRLLRPNSRGNPS